MCVCESERERVCVCVRVRVRERERERERKLRYTHTHAVLSLITHERDRFTAQQEMKKSSTSPSLRDSKTRPCIILPTDNSCVISCDHRLHPRHKTGEQADTKGLCTQGLPTCTTRVQHSLPNHGKCIHAS